MRTTRRILLLLVILLGTLLALQLSGCFRKAPEGPLAELYDTYCNQPGVRTALICNYRVNDTVAVDMLLLTATDSGAWEWMTEEFNLIPIPENVQKLIERGKIDPVEFRLSPVDRPDSTLVLKTGNIKSEFATGNVDSVALVVAERKMKCICIIEIDRFELLRVVINNRIDDKQYIDKNLKKLKP